MERSGFKKIYFAPIKNNVYSSWIEIPDAEELTPSLLGGTEPRYCGDKIAGVRETYMLLLLQRLCLWTSIPIL